MDCTAGEEYVPHPELVQKRKGSEYRADGGESLLHSIAGEGLDIEQELTRREVGLFP